MQSIFQVLMIVAINIPGTHESSTYYIGRVFPNKVTDFAVQAIDIVPININTNVDALAKTHIIIKF